MSNTSLLGSYGGQAGDALMFRNRIINGDMRIDQRNSGANLSLGATTEGYPVDRFIVVRAGGTATLSVIRQVTTISGETNFEANSAPAGFTHALKVQIGTAQAVDTTFETEIKHNLEGFNGADWGWGTADAKPVTLSFWVKSSQTGNFGVGMRSATFNYSIVCSYTINAANTWEYKTIVITPPTSGTFYQDNRAHHRLYWDLGVGSTFSTSTLNTWQSADLRGGLTGGVKLAETANATLYITGVQLEAGPTATPFERRPYSVELSMCQRYCFVLVGVDGIEPNSNYTKMGLAYARLSTAADVLVMLPTMRSFPTFFDGGFGVVNMVGSSSYGGVNQVFACTNSALEPGSISSRYCVIRYTIGGGGLIPGQMYMVEQNISKTKLQYFTAEL